MRTMSCSASGMPLALSHSSRNLAMKRAETSTGESTRPVSCESQGRILAVRSTSGIGEPRFGRVDEAAWAPAPPARARRRRPAGPLPGTGRRAGCGAARRARRPRVAGSRKCGGAESRDLPLRVRSMYARAELVVPRSMPIFMLVPAYASARGKQNLTSEAAMLLHPPLQLRARVDHDFADALVAFRVGARGDGLHPCLRGIDQAHHVGRDGRGEQLLARRHKVDRRSMGRHRCPPGRGLRQRFAARRDPPRRGRLSPSRAKPVPARRPSPRATPPPARSPRSPAGGWG